MTHDDFYIISAKFGPTHMYCEFENSHELLQKISQEEYRSFFKGGKYAEKMPRTFITAGGRKKHDFMRGAAFNLNLVSEKLKTELEEANVTGAEFVPVTVKTRGTRVYADYYAMLVTGRAKVADRELSIPKFFAEKEGFKPSWNDVGYFFPLDSWDGSDIFCCEEEKSWGKIVVTQKVKNILQKYEDGVFIFQCSNYCWGGSSIKIEYNHWKEAFDPNKTPREPRPKGQLR